MNKGAGRSQLPADLAWPAGLMVVQVLVPVLLLLTACATAPAGEPQVAQSSQASVQVRPEEAFGIEVQGLRLSAAGSMLDFRYRVLDATKAAPLLDGRQKPYLLDSLRSARLAVPESPVLGRIRQTSRNNKILTDRTYFIMFGNPGKALQSGDTVSLLLGERKVADLTVQ